MSNIRYSKLFIFVISLNIILLYMIYFNYKTIFAYKNITIYQKSAVNDQQKIVELNQDGVEKNLPFIPFKFFKRNSPILTKHIKDRCGYFPDLLADIQFQNTYWQIFRIQSWTYFLYGAYFDNRKFNEVPFVRVLAMIEEKDVNSLPNIFFQIWFNNKSEAVIAPVTDKKRIWIWGSSDRIIYPYILSCEINNEYDAYGVPQAVSLVEHQCDFAYNSLTVNFNALKENEKKQDFAVCVKGLDFLYDDLSLNLLEWFETVRILGAKKVSIYNYNCHKNMEKVLKYYKNKGFLEVTPFTLSSGEPNLAGYAHLAMKHRLTIQMLNELMAYNDCYMKHMYKYEHIILIDIDEVIMPQNNFTYWSDLMNYAMETRNPNCEDYASICFENVYFPVNKEVTISNQVPGYLYMLQHTTRLNETLKEGKATKCIHNSEKILGIHNHMPLYYKKTCNPRTLDSSIGLMTHYRIPENGQSVKDTKQVDLTLWRFKDEIIARTEKVISEIFENVIYS